MVGGAAKQRVLVVDDEPQILTALEDLLQDDFTVLTSDSAERALDVLAHDSNIAVVVTDQRMPKMRGDEFLARAVGTGEAVGIMVSGFADLPAVISAINQGQIFAYVTKPWIPEDLLEKVTRAAERFQRGKRARGESELLSELMQHSPDGIFFKDRDLKFRHTNRSFALGLTGREPAELMGKALSEGLIPSPEAEAVENEEREVVRYGESATDVVRAYRSADGKTKWFSETRSAVRDDDGEIVGIIGISRDVSERLRVQEALRESGEQLRQQTRILNSVLDGIGEGVIVVDQAGHTLVFNREAQRVLGSQARDAPPVRWAEAYGAHDLDGRRLLSAGESPLLRAMSGEPRTEMEMVIKNSNVQEAHVAVVTTPLRNDREEVVGAIALLRDVTEKRSLEQLLAHSQRMEALGQLAGGIAHDFNNLLAVIEGSGELALEDLAGHPSRADVADILAAAKRASSLSRQLLAFSRREAARPEPVRLSDVVTNVEKMLKRVIGEHVTLLTQLTTEPDLVRVDASQLEQVIINLCINARDAMPNGGTLTLETHGVSGQEDARHRGPRLAILTVSDTGVGMDFELQKRIFEPFFTTKDIGKGTGLGLSMAYGIVNQNGGSISVESDVGRGTSFSLSFPVTNEAPPSRSSVVPLRRDRKGTETILLVEDEPAVRSVTARILRRSGYIVLEASRPSEAVAMCSEIGNHVDLLVTDIVMPEMSGVRLAAQLTLGLPRLRVLYMSGYSGKAGSLPGRETTAARLGATKDEDELVLNKPFTSESLLSRVRAALADCFGASA